MFDAPATRSLELGIVDVADFDFAGSQVDDASILAYSTLVH
jgi:hypothetical protein